MPANVADFLLSLTTALQGICGLDRIWAHTADEASATDPYVGLRVYGGPAPEELLPVPETSIQAYATGTQATATLQLLCTLWDGLHQDRGDGVARVRYDWTIAGRRFNATTHAVEADAINWNIRVVVPQQTPGITNRDARGKHLAVFNFDVRYDAVDVITIVTTIGGVSSGRFVFSAPVAAADFVPAWFAVDEDELGVFPGVSVTQVDAVTLEVEFNASDPGGVSGYGWSLTTAPAGVAVPQAHVFPG